MKIKVKINKSSDITKTIYIEDDFMLSKKGSFYLIKTDSELLSLNPEVILFNEKDKPNSFIINYIKGYDIQLYNQLKYY